MADLISDWAETIGEDDGSGSCDKPGGGMVVDFPWLAHAFHSGILAIIPTSEAKKIAARKMGNLFRIASIYRL
jgi:hypothetical protein